MHGDKRAGCGGKGGFGRVTRPSAVGAGKAGLAFDVCLEVYRAAKDLLAQKITILHHESSSQYQWRPDRRPRLAEFIADFAIAGERALAHRVSAAIPVARAG